jgi:hypothetical protein
MQQPPQPQRQSLLFDIIQYTKDPSEILRPLEAYVRAQKRKYPQCCCVFDIDDTLFMTDDDEMLCIHKLGQFLFRLCTKLGVGIVLVTARQGSSSSRAYCEKQLAQLGFAKYEMLYMQGSNEPDTAIYKRNVRAEILQRRPDMGPIILNCGDQISDHFGEISDHDAQSVRSVICASTYYVLKISSDPAMLSVKFVEEPQQEEEEEE